MGEDSETLAGSGVGLPVRQSPQPGLRLVFSNRQPRCELISIPAAGLTLGRHNGDLELDDPQLSRDHARIDIAPGGFMVHDRDSRNGTFVDGARLRDNHPLADGAVLRLGRSIFLVHHDIRPLTGSRVAVSDDMVAGPQLAAALGAVARAARSGAHVLIRGESGSGKEIAARVFHDARAKQGPFVAVNCATIPATLAESMLFGSRKGAFSGAVTDVAGLIAEADRGVLFLDEVAELDQSVQAKLLRVLEAREVLALGASRARQIELAVCSATLRDVRGAVAAGAFRADLYHRLAGAEVVLPPLRERREEIPFLISRQLAVSAPGILPHQTFVEACLLRPWPGNVRALIAAVRDSASRAVETDSEVLRSEHLAVEAGASFDEAPGDTRVAEVRERRRLPAEVSREALEACLREHGGNISAASRALGLHRTQTCRLIKTFGLKPASAGER